MIRVIGMMGMIGRGTPPCPAPLGPPYRVRGRLCLRRDDGLGGAGDGRMWNGDGRIWNGDGRMWNRDGRFWNGDGRFWNGDGRLWNSGGRIWNGDGRFWNGGGFTAEGAEGDLTTEGTEVTEGRGG